MPPKKQKLKSNNNVIKKEATEETVPEQEFELADEENEDEEFVEEEIIIEEKEEQVEEVILLRLKDMFGMFRVAEDLAKMKNQKNENEKFILPEDSKIALTNLNTDKPLLAFSNGLVLEGTWTETQGNLAAVGIDSSSVPIASNFSSSQFSNASQSKNSNNNNNSRSSASGVGGGMRASFGFASQQQQQQTWAPTLNQRIRTASGGPSQWNENNNHHVSRVRYFVNGSATPMKMITFAPSALGFLKSYGLDGKLQQDAAVED
jgi:hypothetical protein